VQQPDNPWDLRTWDHIISGDTKALVAESTYESLAAVGSGTPGFLDYVFALGAVGGAVPDFAEKVASTVAPPTGFLAWDAGLPMSASGGGR
jgi:protocatechuate 4,5-dioxygenase, beta chain